MTTKQCMPYGVKEEDYEHLFPCPKQEQWRMDFLIVLRPISKTRDGSGPDDCNCYNVRRWLNSEAHVASYQDEVGTWHEFLKGIVVFGSTKFLAFFLILPLED
jgi:hypothetical protein